MCVGREGGKGVCMCTCAVLEVMRYIVLLLFTLTSNVTHYFCKTSNLAQVTLLSNVRFTSSNTLRNEITFAK